jgi:hypothetical protein
MSRFIGALTCHSKWKVWVTGATGHTHPAPIHFLAAENGRQAVTAVISNLSKSSGSDRQDCGTFVYQYLLAKTTSKIGVVSTNLIRRPTRS